MQFIVQIGLTLLLSLSGIIFACAEGSPLGGVTVLVSILTLYFVDRTPLFALSPLWVNVLGLGAFIMAGVEFFSGGIESRLLAGGHLIVYLSWVFLLQQKKNRHYWWLFALSVLQIAVASVLTNAMWFGGALIAYMFLASTLLSVFQVYRSVSSQSDPTGQSGGQPRLVVGDSWKGVTRDVDHRLINARFIGSTLVVTCLSVALSGLFFLFTPRVWIGGYSMFGDSAISGNSITGFSDEVRLGDLGEILENDTTVMTVKLFSREEQLSGAEVLEYFGEEPLFRGGALEQYQQGRWHRQFRHREGIPIMASGVPDFRQEIELEAAGTKTLFAFGNVVGAQSETQDPQVKWHPISSDLFRRNLDSNSATMRYSVFANAGPSDLEQSRYRATWVPYNPRRWNFSQRSYEQRELGNARRRLDYYLSKLTTVPDDLERVRGQAEKLIEGTKDPLQRAHILQSWLRDSDEFEYSMKLAISDSSIDPLEDFLFNRKSGHCEYFASSLTMLLRSADIPARMVNGFKGGTYNESKNAIEVQQLHAHSWVEAYIDGRWHTFDPTPASRDVSVSDREGKLSPWRNLSLSAQNYWDFGSRMSKSQQQEYLYAPIQKMGTESWTMASELVQGKTSRLREMLASLRSPREWFSWQGGLVAFVLLSLISGIVWVVRRLPWHLLQRHGVIQRTAQRPRVRFYEQFCSILKEQGLEQGPSQTAREFVLSAMGSLQPLFNQSGMEAWPSELVEKFYQVRFGQDELSGADTAEIEQRLTALKQCLSREQQEKSNGEFAQSR